MCAYRHRIHPVREYLRNLKWDGIERLNAWLVECGGVDDSLYVQLVGRFFLISMVARVFRPGCPVQYMPIFEGPQSVGKSTLLRILGGEWFAETPFRVGDRDAYQNLQGAWIYEIPEMDSFYKAEAPAVKAFITQQIDRYRDPYAKRPADRPRQCIFAGNTNHKEYFKDTTGNRRFWPIKCEKPINLEKLREWRDQLFAEAFAAFDAGERWHPTRDEEVKYFRSEQEEREIVDPWMVSLQRWLDEPERRATNEFTSLEIIAGAFKVTIDKIDGNRGMATRLGNLMARLEWSKRRRGSGMREWFYVRPQAERVKALQDGRDDVPF
jgi:predicted P-loop ATPase